jgi:hypothetical protein
MYSKVEYMQIIATMPLQSYYADYLIVAVNNNMTVFVTAFYMPILQAVTSFFRILINIAPKSHLSEYVYFMI